MRGFVLAAGLGTRLRPLTDVVPKPMVAVADVPLVERAVRQLVAAGVRDIGVNLYHQPEPIVDWLGDGGAFGATIRYFDERDDTGEPAPRGEPRGTGGALKAAEAWLRGDGDAFVLVNGDVWHSFDLATVLRAHRHGDLATMAVHVDRRRPELHTLDCRPEGHVARFVARAPGSLEDLEAHSPGFLGIYTGVAVFDVSLLDLLPTAPISGMVLHGLGPGLAVGRRIAWHRPAGLWVDCGTLAELQRADTFARSIACLSAERSLRVRSSLFPI